ncbi:MAG: FecR family protein [Gammaproteobacteria bacterium]|uniref:FecR family protein n=1 Tax=Rhodoferax sp. TaxID=50421 RepID=UPI0018208BD6|nr:FecR family protein [Rhodoferax sp.]MBU3898124.1 FecR family protein [Gammaproteobacteria bacterium]MBA3058594.1 FecR domain-containing protein [Rhodoferax sp.]MBU3999119.1 FecR family protein [Gammaproteobacteria bacterium]MBU4081682.1 FecR family protein [Gammaproteobacteria bacterium]MBU4113834.1 FecR family protein [Gammaproteobacteria bacterium]
MKRTLLGIHVFAFLIAVTGLLFSGAASADPPSRAARLAYALGAVSFSSSGDGDWVQATVNRTLTQGDRLWVGPRGRAEVELGGSMIRLNANTGVSVLNLDDQSTQLQLTQGSLSVRVRRLAPDQLIEVEAPNLAVTLREPGDYRIGIDPDGLATEVIVRAGQAEVLGKGAAYRVDARQAYRFDRPDLRTYDYLDVPALDEFDQWALERERAFETSRSARYVSPDVIGYQDLDANGTWREDTSYGPVWTPHRVALGWAPYRDGHWAWINPWGWTWVDDAPWGFAVSHYGRWAHLRGAWAWVPGPVRAPAYYAPALVVFVGGDNFRLSLSSGPVGGVAWFPLAPREVYRPAFPVSRSYFERVNRSNTVVDVNVINRSYDRHYQHSNRNLRQEDYVNRRVPGAVIAVPTNTFVQSRPVRAPESRPLAPTVVAAPVQTAPPQVVPALVTPARPPAVVPPDAEWQQRVPSRPLTRPSESRRWSQPQGKDQRRDQFNEVPMNTPESRPVAPSVPTPSHRLAPPPAIPTPAPAPPPAPRAEAPAPPARQVAPASANPMAPAAPGTTLRPPAPAAATDAGGEVQPRGPRPRPGASKPIRDGVDDNDLPRRAAGDRLLR